jgi:hypothetical protein
MSGPICTTRYPACDSLIRYSFGDSSAAVICNKACRSPLMATMPESMGRESLDATAVKASHIRAALRRPLHVRLAVGNARAGPCASR